MTIVNSCKYRQLFFSYLFLLWAAKSKPISSESNPNYQPPSIENILDKRIRGIVVAAYTGERKRPKKMTLLPAWCHHHCVFSYGNC
jgi:hypothetical protein